MDKRVLAVASPEYAPGFQMAGVEVVSPGSPDEASEIIARAMETGEWGLVIVEESFQDALPPKLAARAFDSTSPVVIFVSLTQKPGASTEEYISSIVREAIGYTIKIRES